MRCGFYETEITPPLGTTMFGYFGKRVCEGVKSKLYAKASVIETGGKCVAFLVIDCIGMPKGLADFVRERVYEKTGIEKDALLIATTHSHTSGPFTDTLGNFKDRVPLLENEPVMNPELDSFYLKMMHLLSADAVINAYQRLEDADISFATGEADGINFIREYLLENGEIRTNPTEFLDKIIRPAAEPDRTLPVFFVKNKEGKPMGLLTSFALHHDTVHGTLCSADYSGIVAGNLKEKFGKDFVSVFYSGFCGNINHLKFTPGKREELKTEYIATVLTDAIIATIDKTVLLAKEDVAFKWETVVIRKREVPEEHTERVLNLKKNPPTGEMTIADPYCDIMVYAGANSYISYYVEDKRTEIGIPVHVVKIGECIVYGFCGEIFSQFGDMIRKDSPSDKIMLVTKGNLDVGNCYVPTREMFLPNVYESTYTSAQLCPDAGYQFVDMAIKLAKEIY